MNDCLLASGRDTSGNPGQQLQHLLHQFCCLHTVKARASPKEWRALLHAGITQADNSVLAMLQEADWLALTVRQALQIVCQMLFDVELELIAAAQSKRAIMLHAQPLSQHNIAATCC